MSKRNKKIKAFDFSDEISRIWSVYGFDSGKAYTGGIVNISGVIEDSMKVVCKEAVAELNAVNKFAPDGHPTGAYSRDWTYEIEPIKRYTRKARVYNEDHYRLTHLLENGHALVRGGREYGSVKAYPHIYPVNEKAHQRFVEECVNRIADIMSD